MRTGYDRLREGSASFKGETIPAIDLAKRESISCNIGSTLLTEEDRSVFVHSWQLCSRKIPLKTMASRSLVADLRHRSWNAVINYSPKISLVKIVQLFTPNMYESPPPGSFEKRNKFCVDKYVQRPRSAACMLIIRETSICCENGS